MSLETLLDINTTYSFVPTDLFILVAALIVLGVFLKFNNKFLDELIPLFLLLLSVIASMLTMGVNITAFLQGIVCWGVSIAIHQTYVQTFVKLKNK